MILQYDPGTDSLHIKLVEGESASSKEVASGIVLGFDERGRVMDIAVKDASTFTDLSRLEVSALPTANVILSETVLRERDVAYQVGLQPREVRAVVTDALEKAFIEASRLTEQEQAGLAAWILEEIAAERRWETAFADSADMLAQLADEALAEHRHGKTQVLDPDQL